VFLSRYVKGYLFSILKGYLFCPSGVQKGKGLDLGAELPHTKLHRVLATPAPGSGGTVL